MKAGIVEKYRKELLLNYNTAIRMRLRKKCRAEVEE